MLFMRRTFEAFMGLDIGENALDGWRQEPASICELELCILRQKAAQPNTTLNMPAVFLVLARIDGKAEHEDNAMSRSVHDLGILIESLIFVHLQPILLSDRPSPYENGCSGTDIPVDDNLHLPRTASRLAEHSLLISYYFSFTMRNIRNSFAFVSVKRVCSLLGPCNTNEIVYPDWNSVTFLLNHARCWEI